MTAARTDRRTYVLDTSVVLSDPGALHAFAEHDVVVPLGVVVELEGKRHHPELGWAARLVLRALEALRTDHGGLGRPLPLTPEGGTLRVEMNHRALDALPPGLRSSGEDARILAVAANLATEGRDVVLVSLDLPLRLRAGLAGVQAEEYRRRQALEVPHGLVHREVPSEAIDLLFAEGEVDDEESRDLPCHTGVVLTAGTQSALARVHPDKLLHRVRTDRQVFGVSGRSAEQRLALDLLGDTSVGVVSLGGHAGTGKTVLALAAGLEAVLEQRTHRRVVVFRPLYAVGGQDLGYLPGSAAEKMDPWARAVYDALDAVAGPNVVDEVVARNLLDVQPLTHIRGRTLTGSFVVVDEAQNLERTVLLTALSRLGSDSRAVLCWDAVQRDNLHVGRHDGVAAVVEQMRGHPLFGHVTLTRSERSPVAALASRLLEESDVF